MKKLIIEKVENPSSLVPAERGSIKVTLLLDGNVCNWWHRTEWNQDRTVNFERSYVEAMKIVNSFPGCETEDKTRGVL